MDKIALAPHALGAEGLDGLGPPPAGPVSPALAVRIEWAVGDGAVRNGLLATPSALVTVGFDSLRTSDLGIIRAAAYEGPSTILRE
jgi:hypothetical protein